MRSLPFFFLKTRRLFFSVCLSALCFTSQVASSQNLTASDIQAAMVEALKEYAEYSSGEDSCLVTLPMGDGPFFLNQYLIARPDGSQDPNPSGIGSVFLEHMQVLFPMIRGILQSNTNLLALLPITDEVADIREISDGILTHVSSLNMDVPYLLSRFEFDQDDDLFVRDEFLRENLTFDNALHLYVHDPDVVAALTQTNVNGGGVLAELNTKAASQIYNGEQILEELDSITDAISDLDDAGESSEEVYGNEYSKTRQWQELQESEAEADYKSIQLPTASIAYEPNFSGMTDEGANYGDLGLNQELPGQHNALIRLVGGSGNRSGSGGNVLPEVEIDLGRDQVLASRLSSFSEFFGWMYGVFGTMLLSVKGLFMFRKCRLASESSAILGAPDPMTSLAWDPF